MAPTEADRPPVEPMFDLETIPESPNYGDMDTAFESFLNLVHSRPYYGREQREEREFLSSAALAAGSRKRKAAEIEEVPSADAPVVGGSEEESEVTRQLRRAIANVILHGSGVGRPCPAPGAVSPGAAAPLPMVTTHAANPANRTLDHGPLLMPFRLPIDNGAASAAPASLAAMAAPEAAACMIYYYNSDDYIAGFGGSPMRGGGAADLDNWLPHNHECKDRQMAGGCIKARSMAERQRWERISEGLQKLRLVVRGHGDTATMLNKPSRLSMRCSAEWLRVSAPITPQTNVPVTLP
ncbi:unnamed protein product [Closterium sp. Yama58-4]|nr:unnamed protein product [Closterium sp. Yama58-4]